MRVPKAVPLLLLGAVLTTGRLDAQTGSAGADTSFYALVRSLVRDSLWSAAVTDTSAAGRAAASAMLNQKPPQSYFATSPESIVLLRNAGIPVDSISALRFIGCEGQPLPASAGSDARIGYVMSASVGAGIDTSALAVHLTVGCKSMTPAGVKVTGHYCGWDVKRSETGWRVLRSRRCWKLE